jgi:multicomponent Na+:H+ antiporter subunit B
MKESKILKSMSHLIYPFVILYGFYVTIHGDLTPGGGFQGGSIIATGLLLMTFFSDVRFNLVKLNKIEKILFLFLIIIAMSSFITKGVFFTNPFEDFKRIFLVVLNLILGFKVSIGLVNILESFLEEGDPF